jgi:hypothetical protein
MHRAIDYATVIERICADDTLRRQFLWLRAREKGDVETARDLESIDPTLSPAVAKLQAQFLARGGRLDTIAERRDGFAQMQDQLFRRCSQAFRKRRPAAG